MNVIKSDCLFCTLSSNQVIFESTYFYLVKDKYPVSIGHTLIISKSHKLDYFGLNDAEIQELPTLILKAKELIEKDTKPDGYNIGMNCGFDAGQTVMHFHCHIIPRYKGDMNDPRGGVRHSVEGRGYYQ